MRKIEQEELNKILKKHKKWLKREPDGERADLADADLVGADLVGADLAGADLTRANLLGADLDFSCLPLWCGSLEANFDDKQLIQIAYHLVKAGLSSSNSSEKIKNELLKIKDLANEFHRIDECGIIE